MMKEGNEDVDFARKRGRDETQTHEDCKPEEHKKCRTDWFYSCLLALESPDLEEHLVCDVDEEGVYNLMKELMEEIGMEAKPPLPPPRQNGLPLACLADATYSSCNSAALSSTNCSSKVADSTKIEPAKINVVKKFDWKDYERTRVVGCFGMNI